MRMRPDGTRLYVSPSVCELLGWGWRRPCRRAGSWCIGRPRTPQATLAGLLRNGDCITVRYRLQRKDGSYYAWMEALAQRSPQPTTAADALEIIYTARDVSERVLAEQASSAARPACVR